MLNTDKKLPGLSSIVSPPPSVGQKNGGTELDAALAHLGPQVKRLSLRSMKKAVPKKATQTKPRS